MEDTPTRSRLRVRKISDNIDTSQDAALSSNSPNVAGLLRNLVQRTNSTIVRPAVAELEQIDRKRSNIESANAALRQEINTVGDRVENWLRTQAAQTCNTDQDVGRINPCDPNPTEILRRRFPSLYTDVNLSAVYEAWSRYAALPRLKRYEELANLRNLGLKIAGGAFVLFILANAFTDGVGFFKVLYLFGILIGAAVAIINEMARNDHRSAIQGAYADAVQQTTAATITAQNIRRQQLSGAATDLAQAKRQLLDEETTLSRRYSRDVHDAVAAFNRVWEASGLHGVGFETKAWSNWKPTSDTISFLRLGGISAPTLQLDQRLQPTSPLPALPALIPFAPGKGICFHGDGRMRRAMVEAMQSAALRLVASIPPGKLRFTFIDPVGLGQNVAPLLSLGDHVEELVGGRAWSEPMHIEQRLAEITQHIETVIQKYLRDEHRTIEDYNKNAGQVVEAYRIVVVCDFPVNCTESAVRRLISIAENGPRCGVYPIILVDADRPLPYGVRLEPLLMHVITFRERDGVFKWSDSDFESWTLKLDNAPPISVAQHLIKSHGELSEAGMRVSLPFGDLVTHTGLDRETWQGMNAQSSADELSTPLGQHGAKRYHNLLLGRGTAHHALVVGQTGSGKSNLLHVLITTLALRYSPDELELYLVDFKQGVEFKLYADGALPHARVIAIQSEREFGLSVLRGLLTEMDRRGDQFRAAGVPSLSDWRKRTGNKLPRILLLVDEFRVFFTVDDTIATEATMIIDRLVSQGRAFGIHVVLASQTLAGSFALPRSITDQMAVRIVLQCTEADSRLALADDNPDARLLSRPGEAIYNDKRGLIEGNHKFQVADMGDDEAREQIVRRYLEPRIATWRGERRRPVIFEGHLPARLEDCTPMATAIGAQVWGETPRFVDAWLGEPIALRPPSSIRFLRQGGANLLVVMRDENQASNLVRASILSLAAQLSPTAAGFHIIDMSSADATWAGGLEQLTNALPHRNNVTSRRGLTSTITELGREVDRRLANDAASSPSVFLILFGLHRMADLRQEEGSSWSQPDGQADLRLTFAKVLREGPEVGIHTLIWADSQSSAARVLDRRMLADCARRVVGPMSEQDSIALIDEPKAGRLDKPHRLIRFDEDRPGDLEVFRPYVPGTPDWFVTAAQQIAARSN